MRLKGTLIAIVSEIVDTNSYMHSVISESDQPW